jgi:hypothetical protein
MGADPEGGSLGAHRHYIRILVPIMNKKFLNFPVKALK